VNFGLTKRRVVYCFIGFGLFGTIGEIAIGSLSVLLGRPLFVYYNNFHTSVESFFLFGSFGMFGLMLLNEWLKRHNAREELQ
jgi:hypothetical protein